MASSEYTNINGVPLADAAVRERVANIEGKESGWDAKLGADHNSAENAHADIRLLITQLSSRINGILDSSDTELDQLSEIVTYIKSNKALIEAVTTAKVSVTDIVDNVVTSVSDKPLSAKQGVVLKGLIDGLNESISRLNDDLTSKLDKNQGTANAGKYLYVDADGNVSTTTAPTGGSGDTTATDAQILSAVTTYMTAHASEFKGDTGDKGDKGDKGDTGEQGIQGETGATGADGYSPTATVTKSGTTATITITDKNGTTTASVSDGKDGADGSGGTSTIDSDDLTSALEEVYNG